MKFDKEFLFGTATSSFQIEGARNSGGKTDSIWDEFCEIPGKIKDNSNGDIACNHYELYEEDIKLMAELGVRAYRFSISWARIFPKNKLVNIDGIQFYLSILNTLKKHNIKAYVTLYHWDLPLWADKLGGWLNRDSVKWFEEYALTCFEYMDDYVDGWITLNEPHESSFQGYMAGTHAPGHNSVKEMVISTHHLLLAHGNTVQKYRELKYKHKIGITLNLNHVIPNSAHITDKLAANNADGFLNRWFLDPIFKGEYPLDMLNLFSSEIVNFDFIHTNDLNIIQEKIDFLGVNYYSGGYVTYNPDWIYKFNNVDKNMDKTYMGWAIYPEGLYYLVKRLRKEYTTLPIYITENGAAYNDQLVNGEVNDDDRIDYINKHLDVVSKLNQENMNIQGYFLWSLLDNFEWAHGYTKRFGIVYVDFSDLKRYPKKSFYEYQKIIKRSK